MILTDDDKAPPGRRSAALGALVGDASLAFDSMTEADARAWVKRIAAGSAERMQDEGVTRIRDDNWLWWDPELARVLVGYMTRFGSVRLLWNHNQIWENEGGWNLVAKLPFSDREGWVPFSGTEEERDQSHMSVRYMAGSKQEFIVIEVLQRHDYPYGRFRRRCITEVPSFLMSKGEAICKAKWYARRNGIGYKRPLHDNA